MYTYAPINISHRDSVLPVLGIQMRGLEMLYSGDVTTRVFFIYTDRAEISQSSNPDYFKRNSENRIQIFILQEDAIV